MKGRKMHKNYVFREFICGISVEETAKLCFKSVNTIKRWDEGAPIPKECKRLMRMHKSLEISQSDEWHGFRMQNDRLMLPTGQLVTAQQLLTGIGLIEIGSELERQTSAHLMKLARAISKLRTG
ncbi:regulator [Vibrio sp. AK197]